MANHSNDTSTIRYVICPHCKSEAPHGIRVCSRCEATVTYGTPLVLVMATIAAAAWLGYRAHRFFYDSWLVVAALVVIGAGGVLSLLYKAFDERVVFRRRHRVVRR